MLVRWIQPIAIEGLTTPVQASTVAGFYGASDFQGKILAVHPIYKVSQCKFHASGRSDVIIAVKGIADGNKPRAKERKNQFEVRSYLQILTAEAG